MDQLFSLKYGIGGICVLLTIMILLRVAEFLWAFHKKKESLSEKVFEELVVAVRENTLATQLLEHRLQTLENSLSEVPKLKMDLRRFYAAVKEIAGERWPSIRDEIMKEGMTI